MTAPSKNDKQARELLSAYVAEFLQALDAVDQGYAKDAKRANAVRKKIDGVLDVLEAR